MNSSKPAGRSKSEQPADARPRPVALAVDPASIPTALRERAQWLVWAYTWNATKKRKDGSGAKGEWDKPPRCARGGSASSTDPSTWATFDEALGAYQRGGPDGVGYVPRPEDGVTIIDLDHCRDPESGTIEPWAARIVNELDTYTEVSPSGTGLRLVAFGGKPGRAAKKGPVEMYDGLTAEGKPAGRYLTFTGQRLPDTPAEICQRQEQLAAVYHRELDPPKPEKTHTPEKSHTDGVSAELPDDTIIQIASEARNGDKFRQLWAGNTDGYASPSDADLSLCSRLGFYCQGDGARVDGLFRRSGLMRPKWDERRGAATYGQLTIAKALSGQTDFYRPRRPKSPPSGDVQRSDKAHDRPAEQGPTTATTRSAVFAVGQLTLRLGTPRRTASGKLVVPISVAKAGQVVDVLTLTSAASGRREAARLIGVHIADDEAARRVVEDLIPQMLVCAAAELERGPDHDRPTIRQVVQRRVPETLRLTHRTERGGAWSEARGAEISRADFIAHVPGWLLEEASVTQDASRDGRGAVIRPALLRAVEAELRVLWSDLLSTLPTVTTAELNQATEAAARFHECIIRLWTRPQTFEVDKAKGTSGEAFATRASLVSRVRTQARSYTAGGAIPGKREKWRCIHPAFAAWWRPVERADGEVGVLLGMRWELVGQIGVELPGVHDQASLTILGERFGVLDKAPPVTPLLSGGKARLAILAPDLTHDLLEEPEELTPEEPEPAENGDSVTR